MMMMATSSVLLLVSSPCSDVLVQLSNIYSQLRGDTTGQKNEDAAQVRTR